MSLITLMCSKHRLAKKKILSPALSQKMFVHYERSLSCEMFNLSETGICKRQEMENETVKGGEVPVKKKIVVSCQNKVPQKYQKFPSGCESQ